MTIDRHHLIVDMLEAYVLDQLGDAERRDVEAHLRVCAGCTRDTRELMDALADVGVSVPAVTPSPTLKQRVLAAVAAEPQEPVRMSELTSRATRQHRSRWIAGPWAAAAVLLIAVAALAFRIEQSRRALKNEVSRTQRLADGLQRRVQDYAGQTDLALSILTAGDMREIPLGGRENAIAAAARAYWSPTRGLLVVADRLPPPPEGRIYQVWVIAGGQPLSAGLLGPESGGRGMLIAPPPRPGVTGGVTVAVTDEPPGGLRAPSGSIRLAGSL